MGKYRPKISQNPNTFYPVKMELLWCYYDIKHKTQHLSLLLSSLILKRHLLSGKSRSRLQDAFLEIVLIKKFTKFTGNHLRLYYKDILVLFLCKHCKNFQNSFFQSICEQMAATETVYRFVVPEWTVLEVVIAKEQGQTYNFLRLKVIFCFCSGVGPVVRLCLIQF